METNDNRRPGHEALVTEPVMLFDIYATGVMEPEDHGETVRVIFYADRPLTTGDGSERVAVARMVLPRSGFTESLHKVASWFARRANPNQAESAPVLVQ